MAETSAQNSAPEVSSFCNEGGAIPASPAIRFVGGGVLEPQIDPAMGPPNSCTLTMSMVASLQPALAAFKPFLNLLDLVATLVQCFQISIQVLTNPTKIKELLKLIPALVQKLNVILGLIPQFPQGIQAWITMIADVIRLVATQLDCAIRMLTSIKRQFDELNRIREQIENTDDDEISNGLQQLFDCGSLQVAEQSSDAMNSLGPIARLLCAIRGLLTLVPGGQQLQKLMALPNPADVGSIDDAITALSLTRDVLLSTIEALIVLTGGLGILPPLEIGFTCPLDVAVDEEPPPPPPLPVIFDVLAPDGVTPISAVPIAAGGVGADYVVFVRGIGFQSGTKAYWGASPMDSAFDGILLRVNLPAGVRATAGAFFLSAVNEPASGGGPFSSLVDPATGDSDSEVQVSEPFAIEVT